MVRLWYYVSAPVGCSKSHPFVYVQSILLRVHQSAFEVLGALIGRHLSNGLVPMTESNLVEVLILWSAIDEHLQTPLLVIFCPHNIFDRSLENDLLQDVEMPRVVFEIFLELRL